MPSIQDLPTPSGQRLYILDCALSSQNFSQGRILSCNTDGSDLRPIITDMNTLPDGITIDHEAGHMYWTNMGTAFGTDSGSIERANLDGSDRQVIVPQGSRGVWTPKQITIATDSQLLYWCDREGMKVMRTSLSAPHNPEVLISTGSPTSSADAGDRRNWCVGIAVDERRGWFYWSQKGPSKGFTGRIFRARISDPSVREMLFDGMPEPIDLELDEENAVLYWTDRGDPPKGNSLNRAFVGGEKEQVGEVEVLASRFHETIGLALGKQRDRAYVSDLAGGVYDVDLQTRKKKVLFPELGDLTGIALV